MSLITIQDLSNYLGNTLTSGGRASAIVDAVNEQVEGYIGSIFGAPQGGKEVTEVLDFAPVIFLKYLNVTEIVELKIDKRIIAEGKYKLNKSLGRIIISNADNLSVSTKLGMDAIEVTYKAGVTTVPADLKLACLQIASAMFNKRDDSNTAGVSSASVGGLNINFGSTANTDTEQTSDGSHDITSYISTLNYYRRRKI